MLRAILLEILHAGYSAYPNASNNADNSEVMVAGYRSTVEEWAQFESSWKLVLAKYEVPFREKEGLTAA